MKLICNCCVLSLSDECGVRATGRYFEIITHKAKQNAVQPIYFKILKRLMVTMIGPASDTCWTAQSFIPSK